MEDNGYVSSESTPKKKKKGRAGKIVAIVLLCAIIGALCAVGGASLWEKYSPVLTKEGMSSILNSSIGKKTDDKATDEAAPADVTEAEITAEPAAEAAVELEAAVPAEPEAEADVKPVEERVIIAAPAASSVPGKAAASEGSPADIYEDNVSSTVGITIKGQAMTYYGITTYEGAGSGFIISSDGYILTNYHVIEDSSEVSVETFDGSVYDAEVIGYDESNDIAVLKIDAENLKPVVIGDSGSLRVGDTVLAIGNPLGLEFQGSVTTGVISALNRTLDLSERRLKLIQTDAAISPGNSGGALVNADGYVIGINSAKIAAGGVEGMGFAIPINTVRDVVEQLMNNGHVVRPYLGVGVFDKESAARQGYQLNVDAGVYVQNVTLNGPADKAGIRRGDIILEISGTKVNTIAELRAAIAEHNVGDTITIVYARDGEKITADTVLKEMPQDD